MKLEPLPDGFAATRLALHQIAFFALAPARYQAVGRMGLMATPGGFGTPPFHGKVVRVEGDMLVTEQAGNSATQTISTIRAAAQFAGVSYQKKWFADFHDPLEPADPDLPLRVDSDSSLILGAWFRFGTDVLDALPSQGTKDDEVTEVTLWPEHFDPATELGNQAKGQRGSYGASPGDTDHPEPYLYVASWSKVDRSNPFWNDQAFGGASLGYAELLATGDPKGRAIDFLLQGYRLLRGG